jgi:hypothetical protein
LALAPGRATIFGIAADATGARCRATPEPPAREIGRK